MTATNGRIRCQLQTQHEIEVFRDEESIGALIRNDISGGWYAERQLTDALEDLGFQTWHSTVEAIHAVKVAAGIDPNEDGLAAA